MPRLKKQPNSKSNYRRMVCLTQPVAEKVEALAREEQRSVASMMRLLIERALASTGTASDA